MTAYILRRVAKRTGRVTFQSIARDPGDVRQYLGSYATEEEARMCAIAAKIWFLNRWGFLPVGFHRRGF